MAFLPTFVKNTLTFLDVIDRLTVLMGMFAQTESTVHIVFGKQGVGYPVTWQVFVPSFSGRRTRPWQADPCFDQLSYGKNPRTLANPVACH